jgi:predicted phage terminase large subunit-like protein
MSKLDLLPALSELEAREAAETTLAGYSRYVLGVSPALHHEVICSHIDDMLNDEFDELIINSPPGSAKSTYTSHALAAYYLGQHPDRNVIIATHTADLSERWSGKVQSSLASPEHARVFPQSTMSRTSTAKSRWATNQQGELLAAGVGGSILGFRADLGIIDDPISGFEQAQSETQLLKVQGWYETDFVTRLKPQAKVVLICQRLSANDLAGYLIQRNITNPTRRQRVLTLKMEAEPNDDPDGTGRQPGDRLWPEWFTPQMVEDAKRDEYKWKTLYQQSPPSETGSWVGPEYITILDDLPPGSELWPRYTAADLALSVNSGDFTVHLVGLISPNLDIMIIDARRERAAPEESAKVAIDLCAEHSPLEYLIDDDNMAKVFGPLVYRMARERHAYVPWKMMPVRGQDKETRAASIRGWFRRGKVSLLRAPWNRWLVNEILGFPNLLGQGVDDGIDCLSLFGRRLASLAAGKVLDAPKPTAPEPVPITLNNLFEDRERRLGSAKRI